MLIKLILLFLCLILFIYAVAKSVHIESNLNNQNIDEYQGMFIIGAILWLIGLGVCFAAVFSENNGIDLRVGITILIGGITMFAEPFVHYIFKHKK